MCIRDRNGGLAAHYSNEGDFTVEGYTFEIGGKNKKTKQIQNVDRAFLVKDDILVAGKKEIPLYLFGFLY